MASSDNKRDSGRQATVIFLHVPKTAGTTLHQIVDRQYPPKTIYSLGPRAQESIRDLEQLSLEERGRIRLLRGHLAYGIHTLLPGPATYFTILRDPVERVLSYYYFVRRNPEHYLHDFSRRQGMTIQQYLESGISIMTDNFQTRLISGVWADYSYGKCPPEILDMARANLQEQFSVVGLTERFDATLLLLKKRFGWGNIWYSRKNVTRNRPGRDSESEATLAMIREHNQLDEALYRYAAGLFAEQWRQQAPSQPVRAWLFGVANGLVASRLLGLAGRLRQGSVRHRVRTWFERFGA